MSSYLTWANLIGTDIASNAAMVDELKFSEALALRLNSSMVYRAMWTLLGMCLKGIRILAWMKVTSVKYCPTGLKTTFWFRMSWFRSKANGGGAQGSG